MHFLAEVDELRFLINIRTIQVIILISISVFSCQIIKFINFSIREKRAVISALFTTGGWPSSHTSGVITLVISLGIFQMTDMGTFDYSFAVAVTYGFIVIHDAMGVRLEASKHAAILNKMVENEPMEEKTKLGFGKKGELKELLGHKRFEVLLGVLYGALVAVIGVIIFL